MNDLRKKLLGEIEDTFSVEKYKNIRENIEEMRVNYIPEQKAKLDTLRKKKSSLERVNKTKKMFNISKDFSMAGTNYTRK